MLNAKLLPCQAYLPTSLEGLRDSLQRLGLQDHFQCIQEVKPSYPASGIEDKLAAEDSPPRLLEIAIEDHEVDSDYHEDMFAMPTQQQVEDLHNQWSQLNGTWVSEVDKTKIIVSSDEADMTILNILALPRKGCSILLSNDSDFCFFADTGHLDYTVSFSTHELRKGSQASREPWHVTNVTALHSSLIWRSQEARITACLFAGHDYTGSGLARVGLQSLSSKKFLLDVSNTLSKPP